MSEVLLGLRQNHLFRVFITHITERRDVRILAAIKSDTGVDVLRGRAQELIELVDELEK
jgi:hypothetical protein